MKAPAHTLWVLFLSSFTFSFGYSSEDLVISLLEKGKEEAEKGNFTTALTHFNKAMGYLKQASHSHPLVEEVQKQIRITKGRFLVARYKNRSGLKEFGKNELLSLSEESENIRVDQCFGSVLAREIWYERDFTRAGELFGFGRRITVLPGAGIEASIIDGSKYTIRAIEAASFQLIKENNFDFHSGSFSLSSLEKNSKCIIKSPLSEFELETDDPFAILMAVTTNGGLKIISLLGEVELKQKGTSSTSLRPGQLIFSLPDGFSRKMSVELSTLMVTSKLITGFEKPPIFHKKLKQQALIQALRTKKRFRTVVGDAKTNSDFQIKVLEEN